MWAIAREVPFLVTVETFSGGSSLIARLLGGLGYVSSGWSSTGPRPIYIHRDGDVVVVSRGIGRVVRLLVRGEWLVLSRPSEVIRPGSIGLSLGSGWRGGGSKHSVEASCPIHGDPCRVSYLLPSVRIRNSAIYFSSDEFSQSSNEGPFSTFSFQVIPGIVGQAYEVRDVLIDVVAFHM